MSDATWDSNEIVDSAYNDKMDKVKGVVEKLKKMGHLKDGVHLDISLEEVEIVTPNLINVYLHV